GQPSWSPDGKAIAVWHVPRERSQSGVSDLGGLAALVIVSPLGGGPEQPGLEWSGAIGRIAWAPDSRWIAASPVVLDGSARLSTTQGIVLVSPSTREQVEWAKLNPAFMNSADPIFSDDGRQLAFVRGTGGVPTELYTVSLGTDGR